MAKSGRNRHDGAYPTTTSVGDMLGMRRHQPAVFDKLLQEQAENRCISAMAIQRIATETETSEAHVRAVASFYALFETDELAASDKSHDPRPTILRLCDGPSCYLRGGTALRQACRELNNDFYQVERTSCLGHCECAPVLTIDRSNGSRVVENVDPAELSLQVRAPLVSTPSEIQLLARATGGTTERRLTKRFGVANPGSVDAALASGAYTALSRARECDPDDIIAAIKASGLLGRGGAGFNTGQKWQAAARSRCDTRYVVCNADESEPGTFKDRMLIENDPHALIEGMAICGRAIGASKGIIYLRGEYANASRVLEQAIHEAGERGLLSQATADANPVLDIAIHHGAGAYICGEETALLESLEGARGEPRNRPPYPATSGYRGKPTVVNNVETFCNIPLILKEGPEQFRRFGTTSEPGTRLFCLSGHIARPGLVEAPSGEPLGKVIDEFGGGMLNKRPFKFALTGGAAGTFVPESLLDVPLAYESWPQGMAIGSGAIIVADHSVGVPEMLLCLLRFFEHESCGKCTPCRIGTAQAREILERIVIGKQQSDDLSRLRLLSKTLEATSYCGLGRSVAWPIDSALKHFPMEFED